MNKNLWYKYIENRSTSGIEDTRKRLVLRFSSYLGGIVILLFSFKNFQTSNIIVSSILGCAGFVVLLNVVLSHFFKKIDFFCFSGSFAIVFMLAGLIISGGHENTGLYWIFPFPIIFYVLTGYLYGLLFNFFVFMLALVLLNSPELLFAEYRPAEVTRFLASYFVTLLLGFIAELFRYRSHSDLDTLNQKNQELVLTNQMTGLLNRRFIDSVFVPQLYEQKQLLPVGVILADIDHFKAVNDQYGHDVGDEVIIAVSKLLKQMVRTSDAVVRFGGEEFLILLPNATVEQAAGVAQKIHENINADKSQFSTNKQIATTLSFGVSSCHSAEDFDNTVKRADKQLYKAKDQGRNQVCTD